MRVHERERFWMVWCLTRASIPRVKHPSAASAITEAKRLAEANPGNEFFVVEAIGSAKKHEPVEWTPFDEIEIPF